MKRFRREPDTHNERWRDTHWIDADGMVACNPRDREAAQRADVGDIATTSDPAAVTCDKCRPIVLRSRR